MNGNGHRTAYRTCPLCEATCGLEIKLDGERIVSIRGDSDDVFSKGFICPKGVALKELHCDPIVSDFYTRYTVDVQNATWTTWPEPKTVTPDVWYP